MRKTRWLQGAFALAIALAGPSAFAADHLDKTNDPLHPADADITDVYSWIEGDKVLLVLNVFPVADATSKFSDAVQYALHVESSSEYGKAGTKTDIIAEFAADQTLSLWVTPAGSTAATDYVTGDASVTTGLASADKKVNVFAGLRADPFYFNLEGFNDATSFVKAAGNLPGDGAGCPTLDQFTATAIVQRLQATADGSGAAANFFETLNVLSIVIEVDKTLLNGGGPILAVWGSTHAKGG
jgi:hypothetical protein